LKGKKKKTDVNTRKGIRREVKKRGKGNERLTGKVPVGRGEGGWSKRKRGFFKKKVQKRTVSFIGWPYQTKKKKRAGERARRTEKGVRGEMEGMPTLRVR